LKLTRTVLAKRRRVKQLGRARFGVEYALSTGPTSMASFSTALAALLAKLA
jgi:hypothetical protein